MMSTKDNLKRVRDLLHRDAVITGQYLDRTESNLRSLEETDNQELPALPSAGPIPFPPASGRKTKTWVKALFKARKPLFPKDQFRGSSKVASADLESWLTERGIPVDDCWQQARSFPSPEQLLAFWQQHGSPQLNQ